LTNWNKTEPRANNTQAIIAQMPILCSKFRILKATFSTNCEPLLASSPRIIVDRRGDQWHYWTFNDGAFSEEEKDSHQSKTMQQA
jgi:hypothetical protein